MGGQAEAFTTEVRSAFRTGLTLDEALAVAVNALGSVGGSDGKPRELPAAQLEVAVLDRKRGKRKFRRITGAALTALLPAPPADAEAATDETPESSGG
jgi:proteasome alpha subunit